MMGNMRWSRKRTESVAMVALVVLIVLVNGAGSAGILTGFIKDYYRKKRKKDRAESLRPEYCRTVMGRLVKDGLVVRKGLGWKITEKGKACVRAFTRKTAQVKQVHPAEADTIVMFDIPEKLGGCRKALRFELVSRGFFLLQKSVWLGAGPLDADFLDFVAERSIERCVHIFSIHKRGTIS